MERLRVRVYRVTGQAEVDVDVAKYNGDAGAVDRALQDVLVQAMAGRLAMGPSDCKYLLLPQAEAGKIA